MKAKFRIYNTYKVKDETMKHIDWSEYELWWPEQQKWLLKHHWMLNKYSIQVCCVHLILEKIHG